MAQYSTHVNTLIILLTFHRRRCIYRRRRWGVLDVDDERTPAVAVTHGGAIVVVVSANLLVRQPKSFFLSLLKVLDLDAAQEFGVDVSVVGGIGRGFGKNRERDSKGI